jgi:ABC-type amino acid transport substrate-binding protein
MNEIAHRASLKIEWTEETNFSNWIIGIQAKRYDVACTPQWPDVAQGRAVAFSVPLFFEGLYPLVRVDDDRFKNDDLATLNSEDVTFATQDNDSTVSLIKAYFPKSTIKQLTTDGNIANFAMDVITKKSDAFVNTRNGFVEFNRNNPTKLHLVALHTPLKWQPATLAVERHEMMLKDFLDNAILDLQNDGTMNRLLLKWEPEKGKTFLRVAAPAKIVD